MISPDQVQRFAAVCGARKILRAGIGTLGERSLHAALKDFFEDDASAHEIRLGPYVADIVGEQGIIEIQTGSFQSLRKKLSAFLEAAPVTVVYPITYQKWLRWVNPDTGDITPRRKSPRTGGFPDAMRELYKIKPLLPHKNLRLTLLLVDIEEYRLLNGWSADKKKGSARYERIPLALADCLDIHGPAAWRSPEVRAAFFPADLPSPFTSKDYAKAARLTRSAAQTALLVLYHMGAVERSGKGQGYTYILAETNAEAC